MRCYRAVAVDFDEDANEVSLTKTMTPVIAAHTHALAVLALVAFAQALDGIIENVDMGIMRHIPGAESAYLESAERDGVAYRRHWIIKRFDQ